MSNDTREETTTRVFFSFRSFIRFVAYCLVLFVVWQTAVVFFSVPKWLVPSPLAVFRSLVSLPNFYARNALYTLTASGLGLIAASVLGALAGAIIDLDRRVDKTVVPILVAMQTFPVVAIAPLITIALGYGIASKVFIAFFICWLPCVFSTLRGLRGVPEPAMIYAKTVGMTALQRYWFVKLPFAIPNVATGIQIAAPFAVVGTVVGEFAGSKGAGLGFVILTAAGDISVDRVYASLLLLAMIGGGFYGAAAIISREAHRFFGATSRQ